ncbi:MAG: hypothetical protein ACK5NF_05165 [Bacilli bacterium]
MISDKDMIELSTLQAYANHQVDTYFTVNNNEFYVCEVYNESNGMKKGTDAMLVKNEYDDYALIFVGSKAKNDLWNDWIVNNGLNLFKISPPQYDEGLKLYNDLSNIYNIKQVGGVSLGGGVSTYVGIRNNEVKVTSVNPAPQTFKIEKEYDNITTIIDKNDILFNMSSIFMRRDYYVKNITFFDRGNSFFKNIKLNHIGYDKDRDIYLDDSYPFDLLTNNLTNNYIDISTEDIMKINDNLFSYEDNNNAEINSQIMPTLLNNISNYKDSYLFNNIYENIVIEIKSYMSNTLPTLKKYIDFSHFFDEIEELGKTNTYLLLCEIVDTIINELDLRKLNHIIYNDCNNGVMNFKIIKEYVVLIIESSNNLVSNIDLTDKRELGIKYSKFNSCNLFKSFNDIKISYFLLFSYAKDLILMILRKIINCKFYTIDLKIDAVIKMISKIVDVSSEVIGLISSKLSTKLDTLRQILHELYVFDLSDFVYNLINIFINQIIYVVLPEKFQEIVNSFKYFSQLLLNANTVYDNYLTNMNFYKSNGLDNIKKDFLKFKIKHTEYYDYLRRTYI